MKKEIIKMIEGNPVALATTGKDGNPYVIAVSGVKVVGRSVIITHNYMQTSLENMKRHPSVSIAVWDSKWQGYQLFGNAQYYNEGKWKTFVKSLKENRGEPCRGAVVVDIKHIKKLK